MTTVNDLHNGINEWAPFSTAMSFDNVGTLVGDPQAIVTTALVALDVTNSVLEEAISLGAQVIITHHPVIFQPLKRLTADCLPYRLAQQGIAVISAHTNYDLAPEGVNHCLAEALGLVEIQPLCLDDKTGLPLSLVGKLEVSLTPREFAQYVKVNLNCGGVKYTEGDHPICTVAVGCGAGSSAIFDCIARGIDGFVTGECKHHELLAAKDAGITMVDAGHFNTEHPAMEPLRQKLAERFPDVQFYQSNQTEPTCYL